MGQPAAKKGDQVVATDTHIVMVPAPPAPPVPTPLPHPFTGLVLDPMGAAMNAAMGGGVVLVNGLFVTNCGTGVMNIPPHLPVPGPFAKGKPENDAELWFGALNVSMGGSLAVRLGEIALSCSDPVRMPTSVVIAIPKGPLVIVPRPPVPDLMTIASALGFKALGAALKKAGKLVRKFQRGAGSKFFKKVSKRLRKNKPKSRAAQKVEQGRLFSHGASRRRRDGTAHHGASRSGAHRCAAAALRAQLRHGELRAREPVRAGLVTQL
jgi:uncharacterized Zn-binding protein involved in type VI secretion